MKIQPHKYLGLNFDADMQIQIYNMQKKTIDEKAVGDDKEKFAKEV